MAKLTRFGVPEFTIAKARPSYTVEFRLQFKELVRAGRTPEKLAREIEPTAQSIRTCVSGPIVTMMACVPMA